MFAPRLRIAPFALVAVGAFASPETNQDQQWIHHSAVRPLSSANRDQQAQAAAPKLTKAKTGLSDIISSELIHSTPASPPVTYPATAMPKKSVQLPAELASLLERAMAESTEANLLILIEAIKLGQHETPTPRPRAIPNQNRLSSSIAQHAMRFAKNNITKLNPDVRLLEIQTRQSPSLPAPKSDVLASALGTSLQTGVTAATTTATTRANALSLSLQAGSSLPTAAREGSDFRPQLTSATSAIPRVPPLPPGWLNSFDVVNA
jgi:hypothetical protein